MRLTPCIFTTIAALSIGMIAPSAGATDTSSLRLAQAGEAQGTSQAEGTKKEQLQGKGGTMMNQSGRSGPATTGAGTGSSGSSQRPGGTNNEQTGTQSHDAQKGGGGREGAR